SGVETPKLLFTTYTNALVSYSQSLLQSLLGADAKLVVVRTADSVARELADLGGMWKAPTDSELKKLLVECRTKMTFAGNALQQRAQRQTIEKLGTDYLLEEILDVIDGRGLSSAAEYESARRPGRDVPLNKTQRGAVWAAREAFHAALTARKLVTWEDLRARAAARAPTAAVPKYDGVIVDEAQDLSPTTLRMLAALSRSANRVFFTADANQSIYGASFRWQDVHADLKFQGRTGVLKANYRSTREIGEAANGYLAVGEIEDENVAQAFAKSGPLPAIRAVATTADEVRLLDRFVRSASKELRLGMGACAILVPSNDAGERIASALQARKIPTAFMHGKDLDLKSKSVKVITLKSAKGLEFPCVALAGFVDGSFPFMPPNATDEERDEVLKRERRTMYVAMTRAMHSLLLVVPKDATSPLLTGFDTKAWNLGEVAT
ncbi:MAG: 3'-5' exonuclease, partial [Polyangiales bacterium]